MKTIMTSNWRPLRRALCTLLVGIAALWAMPIIARAQLLDRAGEYNATTGATINANFITGLELSSGLALSGNNLFVANYARGTVGEYNATTGAAINANLIAGLSNLVGLALSGNNLFVANTVPEPSTWAVIAVGGVALLGIMHRKKLPHRIGDKKTDLTLPLSRSSGRLIDG